LTGGMLQISAAVETNLLPAKSAQQ
jgi:hypothetical protein